MNKKNFSVFLILFVIPLFISGCEGHSTGIMSGDTTCNMPETWQTRFTVNGDTVKDNKKGLVWTKDSKTGVNWQEAADYCKGLKLQGLTWHLPTKAELNAILGKCPQDNGCLLSSLFDRACGVFWTDNNTTYKDNDTGLDVKVFGFVDTTFGGNGYDKADEEHLVKCVSSK